MKAQWHSGLTNSKIRQMIDNIDESWKPLLRELFNDSRFAATGKLLNSNMPTCPERKNIFRAFEHPLDHIKLVIVGQDPYPTNELANGIAFAVPSYMSEEPNRWPGSLTVLAQSVEQSGAMFDFQNYPGAYKDYFGGDLRLWTDQGILLLNRYMTCAPGNPGSHKEYWEWFMPRFMELLGNYRDDLVYYLLGSPAKELQKHINPLTSLAVFTDWHPAYVMRKRQAGETDFQMEGHWKEIRQILKDKYGHEILFFYPF